MAQHALLSPSGADGWMTCTGKVAMEFGKAEKPSAYADEGTAAHFLGGESLIHDTHPATYVGRRIVVGSSEQGGFDGAVWEADVSGQPADWKTRQTFEVDLDMVAAVNTYVQGVKRMAGSAEIQVEVRLPLTDVTGEPDAFGTSDAIVLVPYDDDTGFGVELQVHDLKYGQGVGVSADHNRQMRIYGTAWRRASPDVQVDRVRYVIHQPRKFNEPDVWVEAIEDAEKFAAEVKVQATAALLAFEHRNNWLGKDDSYLHASEDACRWCKAAAECPKLKGAVEATVGHDLAEFADLSLATVENIPVGCSDDELGLKLASCDLLEKFIAAVRAEVESRLLACANAEDRCNALGYKLVAGKRGARAWTSEEKAEEMLKSMRLKQEEMYSFKVISPTQAEKIFGEKGSAPSVKRWNKLQELIVQKDGAPHVAPLTDKRPALVIDQTAGMEDETGADLA